MTEQALELMPAEKPQELIKRSTDIAGVCREIVLKSACQIQGKKYIKAEGWMSIATAHGCIASSRDVKKIEGGFSAIGEIKRINDGVVLSTAEGFVGRDEKRWATADEYACRAMAQTRAISRACRAAFAHIVVLMDAGLSTTPMEEVPDGGFDNAQPASSHSVPVTAPKPAKTNPSVTASHHGEGVWQSVVVPKFIKKYAGLTLGDMEARDILWWAQNYEPKPYKGTISQADLDFKAALEAALADLKQAEESDEPPF